MRCEVCGEFEATFTIEWGKRIFDETTWMDKIHLCEMCLIDYEDAYKKNDLPYRVIVIPEVVTFT